MHRTYSTRAEPEPSPAEPSPGSPGEALPPPVPCLLSPHPVPASARSEPPAGGMTGASPKSSARLRLQLKVGALTVAFLGLKYYLLYRTAASFRQESSGRPEPGPGPEPVASEDSAPEMEVRSLGLVPGLADQTDQTNQTNQVLVHPPLGGRSSGQSLVYFGGDVQVEPK